MPQPSNSNSSEFWGTMCKGHFRTAAWNGKRTVACEGGHKWISGKVSTCPHTGKTYKTMMGGWGGAVPLRGLWRCLAEVHCVCGGAC